MACLLPPRSHLWAWQLHTWPPRTRSQPCLSTVEISAIGHAQSPRRSTHEAACNRAKTASRAKQGMLTPVVAVDSCRHQLAGAFPAAAAAATQGRAHHTGDGREGPACLQRSETVSEGCNIDEEEEVGEEEDVEEAQV
ncbi:hypothetical protein TRV_07228 [Trichophyton verrucosum HKI 0517]|uniref:Uncharacterized protein n=1 Tax=Trichophyton verrucosum (strain HKI 0517) TaxID=663202 RepID=D4DJ62_TRIVH|nr:uncharacterized protein TRV_07228 [Trichophyton verrucosum HKI 0517]EFE38107.1 hypothetical protein TRV_07228 [Trichophyton verrucosum HKI 0517]